jgi:hypothetical protein
MAERKALIQTICIAAILLISLACGPVDGVDPTPTPEPGTPGATAAARSTPALPGDGVDLPAGLLRPEDLAYEGAFRLPEREPGAPDAEGWEYGGQALAYWPGGDPTGDEDGHPGSLFGTGHDVWNFVSEIAIPAPSASRNLDALPVAVTLQGFHDVRGGLFDGLDEMPRVGLEALPPLGEQSSPHLYLAWGQHLHGGEGERSYTPSHAWCELDLAEPATQGAWWIGDAPLFSVNGYMFEIPEPWAAVLGGARLATGRYRDGGWSGMGPALFAVAPWLAGNPPAPGTRLDAQTLLLYSTWEDEERQTLAGYHDADEWEGGAWVTAGDRAAVVIVGTKGGGDYWWYGSYSPAGDGAPCPFDGGDDETFCFEADGTACAPEVAVQCTGYVAESRGWWSSRFDAQFLFYDPAALLAVAGGLSPPHAPQPYTVLDVDEHLFLSETAYTIPFGPGDQHRLRLLEAAYDRERGLLYVIEPFADGAKPVVHVWRVG